MSKFLVVTGIGTILLTVTGCELGNQPVYYGGDILLHEDFNNYADGNIPDGWEVVDDLSTSDGPSSWGVYSVWDSDYQRALYQYSDIWGGGYENNTFYGTTIFAGDESWTDYSFQVEFTTSYNDGVGFDFRAVPESSSGKGFYRLMFMNDVNNGGPFAKLLYYDYSMGQSLVLASRNDISYDTINWNSVKITVVGTNISCEFNGNQLFSVNDSRLTHGRIGLFCFHEWVYFDNVLVTALDEAPPSNGFITN